MVVAKVHDLVDEISAWLIGGVGFTCEHQLNRAPFVLQEPFQTVEILKEERCPLVRGESPRKADRQGFGIEERASAQHLRGLKISLHPSGARALTNKSHELPLHRLANGPQFMVRDIEDALPHCRIVAMIRPGRVKRLAVQAVKVLRDPRGCMDAVRHTTDGYLFDRQSRPKMLPHLARDAAMLTADPVDMG